MIYPLPEEQVRSKITKEEAINLIEIKYGAKYDPSSYLDAWDQLLACKSVVESTPIINSDTEEKKLTDKNDNGSVNGNGNDIRQRRVNFELTESKLQVIAKLKICNYQTPPINIAELLEEFFSECRTKRGWWLSVAQQWPPRPIYRVIERIINLHNTGRASIQNPAAYFTFLIKFRKKRRSL